MELVLQIAGVIALLTFSAVCIKAITFFKEASEFIKDASVSLDKMDKTLEIVKDAIIPALKNIEDSRNHIVSLTSSIEKQISVVSQVADPLVDMIQNLYVKISQPIEYVGHLFTGVTKALDKFRSIVSK